MHDSAVARVCFLRTGFGRRQNKWDSLGYFLTEDLAHLGLMLSRLSLMVQAAVSDGEFLDLFSPFDDGRIPSEVSIGGRDVIQALVVAMVVVMLDEGPDLVFEIAGQVIVLQQDAVLQRLMPTLDFALGLGMVWCTADVIHALTLEPDCKIAGDVGRAVVAEQTGFVNDLGGCHNRTLRRLA